MNLKFLDTKKLKDFPAGAALGFHDDQLYVVGEDARFIRVMNKNWKMLETLNLFPEENEPGNNPADECEATTIIQIDKKAHLLMMGTGQSEGNHNKGVLMNLATRSIEQIDLTTFYERIKQSGFESLNIEAATVMDDKLVLCSRGSKDHPENRLIVTSTNFWKKQQEAEIFIAKIELEEKPEKNLSITGITYSYKNDWLIITATSENPPGLPGSETNGDGYLSVIENGYRKIDRKRIKPNELINLTGVTKKMRGHKVESVCLQADKEQKLKLHLATRDENGDINLFKLRLKE